MWPSHRVLAGLSLSLSLLGTLGQNNPAPVQQTSAPITEPSPAPTKSPTIAPTPAPSPGPTEAPTPGPTLAPSPSPTPGPTLAPTLAPTPAPTFSKAPTLSPTPAPTPPPTFAYLSFCERPYVSNQTDVPCVELATGVDRESGVGAFYDEEGCGGEFSGTGYVGCSLSGVTNCRLCVFNRALYSLVILDGEKVPFVDCPCCVPDTYGMGGDIDCNFTHSAAPLPVPVETPVPTGAPMAATAAPGTTEAPLAPGDRGAATGTTPAPTVKQNTPAPTVPPIPMEPCEIGAGGDKTGNAMVCVDIASTLDWANGIGTYYEEGCEGLGCNILGYDDCRQCIFDEAAYAASGGEEALVDCPCCVPITYELRPDDSDCIWPVTPSPISLEGSGVSRPAHSVVVAAVGLLGGLFSNGLF